MKNLAGNSECDKAIRRELKLSRINAVEVEKKDTEVPYSVIGSLGSVEFRRGWRYWIVYCAIPLRVAKEIYDDPVGKEDVRVAGHAGGPSPEDWVTYMTEDGARLIDVSELPEGWKDNRSLPKDCRVVDNPKEEGRPVVTGYHIDSLVGLRFFADILRKHNLV